MPVADDLNVKLSDHQKVIEDGKLHRLGRLSLMELAQTLEQLSSCQRWSPTPQKRGITDMPGTGDEQSFENCNMPPQTPCQVI